MYLDDSINFFSSNYLIWWFCGVLDTRNGGCLLTNFTRLQLGQLFTENDRNQSGLDDKFNEGRDS